MGNNSSFFSPEQAIENSQQVTDKIQFHTALQTGIPGPIQYSWVQTACDQLFARIKENQNTLRSGTDTSIESLQATWNNIAKQSKHSEQLLDLLDEYSKKIDYKNVSIR